MIIDSVLRELCPFLLYVSAKILALCVSSKWNAKRYPFQIAYTNWFDRCLDVFVCGEPRLDVWIIGVFDLIRLRLESRHFDFLTSNNNFWWSSNNQKPDLWRLNSASAISVDAITDIQRILMFSLRIQVLQPHCFDENGG